MSEVELLLMERLQEYISTPFYWNSIEIYLQDIENYIHHTKHKLHNFDRCDVYMDEWNKRDHIERILYFIDYPEKIDAIHIDNKCVDSQIYPIPFIEDGQHRFLASAYRKEKYIPVIYSGRIDLLDYLKGDSDIKPEWW